MDYRFAELADIPALAEAHAELQRDTGASERPSPAEIEKLFWKWLGGEHRVVLFERGQRLAERRSAPAVSEPAADDASPDN